MHIDQLNRKVNIPANPQRIISIVPSQTELLYDLGLKERIVAQTVFCVHPANEFKTAIKIGGTKKLDLEKIFSLKPDLIIANKEENEKSQIEELEKHFPVWISDIETIQDALDMINSIGKITQTQQKALAIIDSINQARAKFKSKQVISMKVIYLIWQKPYIAVGRQTFIKNMLEEVGFVNMIEENRYPEISVEDLKNLNADYILLSSEPFPFNEFHKSEIENLIGKKNCIVVDGEFFSWYGSRMMLAYPYFGEILKKLP